MKFRDGINLMPKLEIARNKIRNSIENEQEKWRNNIYSHWLLLITTLSKRDNYPKDSIYDNPNWKAKQINAQLGSYCELRHDFILSVEQNQVSSIFCSHPEVYVEPNIKFWSEMKNIINHISQLIKKLVETLSIEEFKVAETNEDKENIYSCDESYVFLTRFNESLDIITQVVECQVQNKPIEKELDQKIKGITYFYFDSYNTLQFNGWYLKMFFDLDLQTKFNFQPEVADIFTDCPDSILNDPGYVLHLGTKPPKIGLILIKDPNEGKEKCFLMCSYNPVEIYKPFGVRLTDEMWKKSLPFMKPVEYSNKFIEQYQPKIDFKEEIEEETQNYN